MKAWYRKYELRFKKPAKTSRNVFSIRPVWFLFIEKDGITGIGECAPIEGLSSETPEEVEILLKRICVNPEEFVHQPENTSEISSVHFALETALNDLSNGGKRILFPSAFTEGKTGIPVNGLIWMGNKNQMKNQIIGKLENGSGCIKLKIGGISFNKEIELLKFIREQQNATGTILRLDANGAFSPFEALDKLLVLASMEIHSIEQPIAAGQWEHMARICQKSPIPVALDEELTGIHSPNQKEKLLDTIKPQYLVLKPSLHGGLSGCSEWIKLARERNIGWWVTSYLESNIGLNAIAQWAFYTGASGYQGLGTGSLFTNNIGIPLGTIGDELWFHTDKEFNYPDNFFET